MAAVLRSLRPSVALRAAPRPAAMTIRPFSVSALVKAHGPPPPQLYGPGSKDGEMPTDENQSTGLERFELLGDIHGVDVFDMKALEMTRMGTIDDPIKVFTLHTERIVGCTGFPADSHDTIWLRANTDKQHHRCPECGCVYELDFQGDPAVLEASKHHH